MFRRFLLSSFVVSTFVGSVATAQDVDDIKVESTQFDFTPQTKRHDSKIAQDQQTSTEENAVNVVPAEGGWIRPSSPGQEWFDRSWKLGAIEQL